MRLTGKYVGNVSVSQFGNTVIVVFKQPKSDINSIYWYNNNKLELLGTTKDFGAIKDGNAEVAILSDGTVLVFHCSSYTGPGGDAELHVNVLPRKVPVQGMPNFTTPNYTVSGIDETARASANSAATNAANAKSIADSANNRAKALENRVKNLEGKPISTLTQSQVEDIVWTKVADRLYYELGLQDSGVKGRIIDIVRSLLNEEKRQ